MLIPAAPPFPAKRIAGWAVRWNTPSTIHCPRRGKFEETIAPYSFSDAIASGAVDLIFDHDASQGIIASQGDGALVLSQDVCGLWFEADINDSLIGDQALAYVRGAGYRAASVGMVRVESTFSDGVDGIRRRLITRAGLQELSICTRGAHSSARIAAGRMPIDKLRRDARLERLALAEAAVAAHR